jgi:hypothetical protein
MIAVVEGGRGTKGYISMSMATVFLFSSLWYPLQSVYWMIDIFSLVID